jgi:hypothetical protein
VCAEFAESLACVVGAHFEVDQDGCAALAYDLDEDAVGGERLGGFGWSAEDVAFAWVDEVRVAELGLDWWCFWELVEVCGRPGVVFCLVDEWVEVDELGHLASSYTTCGSGSRVSYMIVSPSHQRLKTISCPSVR